MDDDPTDNIAYLEVPIAITSCIIYIFVGIAIHHYKETYHHMPWIHESSVVCLIGVLMGGIIKYHTGVAMAFDSNLFFYLVLPPVIFSAGYSLKRKNFFKYMDLIAFFGIFGTIANFVLIAGGAYAYGRVFSWPGCYRITWSEAMVFSAVLTGSDEVSARSLVRIKDFPRMGALIFGEGVVNDALSIVLFKTFLPMYDGENQFIPLQSQLVYPTPSTVSIIGSVSMQLVCSLLIGLCCGLLHARLMRAIPVIRHFPIYQTALVMLFGYLSYCIAEGLGISGILTVFIAAIALAHYSWYNLSSSAQIATRISFAGISEIAEGFAFSYVGLSLWVYESTQINVLFSIYMIIVVIGARLLSILVLFKVCSYCAPSFRVPLSEQLCFVLGGVVRGCLCWAQILQIKHSPVLITTTLIIVMSTSLGSGVLLPMLLPMLQAPPAVEGIQSSASAKRTPAPAASLQRTSAYLRSANSSNSVDLDGPPPLPSRITTTSTQRGRGAASVGIAGANPVTPERHHADGQQPDFHALENGPAMRMDQTEERKDPEHPEEHALHFAYEPFSADFSHTQTRPRSTSARMHTGTSSAGAGAEGGEHPDLNNDPLDDLRSNEELIALITSRHAATRPSVSSMLFWQWVRFDETFMKPLFGGSDRRYRLLQERSRQSAQDGRLWETESIDHPAILQSNSASVELPPLHPPNGLRGLWSAGYGSLDSTDVQVGSQGDLPSLHARSSNHHTTSASNGRANNIRNTLSSDASHQATSASSHGKSQTTRTATSGRPTDPINPLRGALPAAGLDSNTFLSPGGHQYVLEEDREEELELERMAEELCALDRSMDDREG